MGRGDAQTQMEFSAKREMKCCDWSIDDMREADCKNWRKSPKGFFDKLRRGSFEPRLLLCSQHYASICLAISLRTIFRVLP